MENRRDQALRLFLLITIGSSILVEALIIASRQMDLTAVLMWMPALGAYIVKRRYYRGQKAFFGFTGCKIGYLALGVLLPLFYIGVPYLIYWGMHPDTIKIPFSINFFVMLVIGIPMSMLTAMGEEIGWRGYLVWALCSKYRTMTGLLLSSVIWGLWHVPLLVSGLYMPGTPLWYQITTFLLLILPMGCVIGMLTLRSRSLWPAILFHTLHNYYDQLVFGQYTIGDDKMYFVSETGMFTILFAWITFAVLYWLFRKEKKGERR